MKTRVAVACAIAAGGALACRDIVGIHDIAYDDAGTSSCNGGTPTLVFSSAQSYDWLTAQSGFLFAEVYTTGVDRCSVAGCTSPSSILSIAANSTYWGSAITPSAIDYAVQGSGVLADGGTGGEIHTTALDGTNDKLTYVASAQYPSWLGVNGAKIFWADDEYTNGGAGKDSVECIGCNGAGSTPWITGLPGGIYGVVADANQVYVLADDASITSLVVLACSTTTPCGATPRTVVTGLDSATTSTQIASDGTYFYVARESTLDVARIDQTGKITEVVQSEDVLAIAIDAAANNLYFGTAAGVVGRVKSDGSGTVATLACNQPSLSALAVDDTSVYFLGGATTSTVSKLPK